MQTHVVKYTALRSYILGRLARSYSQNNKGGNLGQEKAAARRMRVGPCLENATVWAL